MVDLGTFAIELEVKKNNRGNLMISEILGADDFF